MTKYLVLSAFTSSPISLIATTKASVSFFIERERERERERARTGVYIYIYIYKHHQHILEADVYHLISSPPRFPLMVYSNANSLHKSLKLFFLAFFWSSFIWIFILQTPPPQETSTSFRTYTVQIIPINIVQIFLTIRICFTSFLYKFWPFFNKPCFILLQFIIPSTLFSWHPDILLIIPQVQLLE